MTSMIDSELARSLEDASAALIGSIRRALRNFHAAPPDHRAAWESRTMPSEWEIRVLANLEGYHSEIQAALRAHQAGDVMPITLVASSYGSLSKDLDGYHMDWMLEQDRLAVDHGIDQVVGVADRIHRLGYDELAKVGRV